MRGLQGQLGSPTSVLATAKHYLGDGGTFHGKDQGETRTSELNLQRTHAAGYYGALKANVQTVMVSYSSFTDTATGKRWGKMHGNAHLVGDVLKKRLGFDGLVVSDWNGIEQVPGLHQMALSPGDQCRDRPRDGARRLEEVHRRHRRRRARRAGSRRAGSTMPCRGSSG